MMERCNKAGEGFECVRLLGHAGDCECVSADMFNTLMEDAENAFLYGNKAKCMVVDHIGNKPDHADELGKVWDVLHANGINGTGGLSASEGVKLLANKVKPPLKQCRDGYGHAGTWCGPEYQCWLDPRSKGERKGHPKDCPCRECSQ